MACKELHDSLLAPKSLSEQYTIPPTSPIDQPEGNVLPNVEPIALGITLLPSVELYPPSTPTVSGCERNEKQDQNVAFETNEQNAVQQSTKITGQKIQTSTQPTLMTSTQPTSKSDQDEVEFILSVTRKRKRKRKHNQDQIENYLPGFHPLTQADHIAGRQNLEAHELKMNNDTVAPEYNTTPQIQGRFKLPVSPACPLTREADTILNTFPIIRESDPASITEYSISRDRELARMYEPQGFQYERMATKAVPKIAASAQRKRRHCEEYYDDLFIDPELRKLDQQTRDTQQADRSSQSLAPGSSYTVVTSKSQQQVNSGPVSLNPAVVAPRSESSLNLRASSSTPSSDQLRRPSLYGVPVWPLKEKGAETSTTNSGKQSSS